MRGVLASVRDIVPIRPLSVTESLDLAERQADLLLELSGVSAPPVPETAITGVPRLEVERLYPSPVSGAAQWRRGRWLILLKASEPPARQRFTLAHEFKHILDHPFIDVLYPSVCTMTREQRAEHVCDHFAACLLMPRRWLAAEIDRSGLHPARLARQFGVSHTALSRRLRALGYQYDTHPHHSQRKEPTHASNRRTRRRCHLVAN